ncbi:hypothetical protein M8J76_004617 [Diaphorina citri]|nr:hypothetical protein M8J76_011910 [Diaphorina citri]KAI5702361.1 hypothetical protein M8J76_004617 [Diaphorina citri]
MTVGIHSVVDSYAMGANGVTKTAGMRSASKCDSGERENFFKMPAVLLGISFLVIFSGFSTLENLQCAGILSFMRKKAVDFLMQKARPSILDNRHSSLECLAFYSSCFIFYTGQLTFALRVPGILFIVFHLLYWTTDIRS